MAQELSAARELNHQKLVYGKEGHAVQFLPMSLHLVSPREMSLQFNRMLNVQPYPQSRNVRHPLQSPRDVVQGLYLCPPILA